MMTCVTFAPLRAATGRHGRAADLHACVAAGDARSRGIRKICLIE
jgi:hypothetical protein